MTDQEWIDSLKNGGIDSEFVNPRKVIIDDFVSYYKGFQADDEDEYDDSMFSPPLFDE